MSAGDNVLPKYKVGATRQPSLMSFSCEKLGRDQNPPSLRDSERGQTDQGPSVILKLHSKPLEGTHLQYPPPLVFKKLVGRFWMAGYSENNW